LSGIPSALAKKKKRRSPWARAFYFFLIVGSGFWVGKIIFGMLDSRFGRPGTRSEPVKEPLTDRLQDVVEEQHGKPKVIISGDIWNGKGDEFKEKYEKPSDMIPNGAQDFEFVVHDEGGNLLPSGDKVREIEAAKNRVEEEYKTKLFGPGPLEHKASNLCWHPANKFGPGRNAVSGVPLVLNKGCYGNEDIMFTMQAGVIMHQKGQVCIRPERDIVDRETNVILSDKCDDEYAKWRLTRMGDIQHIRSQFCVHVHGGSRSPQPNTGLVLFDQCGLDRNAFALVDNVAVSIEKVIPGDPPIITDPDKLPKKVAVSILISKDPGLKNGFLDSAAAIAQSVYEAKSEFKLDLLAIVAPAVQECRPALVRMGYRIIEKPLPVELSEIKNQALAKDIETDGCCGAWEFLKLWAWTFTDYDRILQVDADIHFHRNFDEVFKYDVTLAWTHGALGGSEVMNGGFLVIRPNKEHFDEMCDIIREGNFQEGRGWLGKCCWTYGARTIQGLVPAYYLHHIKRDNWEIDRCRYNNMVEIDRCKTWRFEDVKSNHFTVCQKPWTCARQPIELCEKFTESWWLRTEALRERLGYDKGTRCSRGYQALDWGADPPSETRVYENQIYTDT